MRKPKNLKEALEMGLIEGIYFSSEVPFYNQGTNFMLYKVCLDIKPPDDGIYFFVVPSRYDEEKRVFVDLIPTEVFMSQHLYDPVFLPEEKKH